MTFEETIQYLENKIDDISLGEFFGPRKSLFYNIIQELKKQFEYLIDNEKIYDFNREQIKKDIIETSIFWKSVYLDVAVGKTIMEFVLPYCVLVLNWNTNVLKDNDVNIEFSVIYRMYQGVLTTSELIDIAKLLISRVNEMKDFAVPSIEISRLYLEMLDKENVCK